MGPIRSRYPRMRRPPTKPFEENHMTRKTPPNTTSKLTPPLAPGLPVDEHEEELIDEALTETFPASDPIAIPTPQDSSQRKRTPRKRK